MAANHPFDDLLAELHRLRAEGVETVVLSEESRKILQGLTGKAAQASSQVPPAHPAREAEIGPAPTSGRPAPPQPPQASRREPLAKPMPAAVKPVIQVPRFDDSGIPDPLQLDLPAKGSKAERLAALNALVAACPECRRHLKPGSSPVIGSGSIDAEILLVAEVPSAADEAAGRLFAGPEATVVDGALRAMGLSRESVYITSLMRWRTASANGLVDRTPAPRELAYCLPYLRAELAVVRPKVVIALGGTVFHALTGDKAKISEARGGWREVDGLPLLPTFHPAYLVKNPSNGPKRQFWEDLLAVMARVGLPISDKQRGFFR